MRKHKDTVPSAINTHVCQICGRFFRSLSGLKSHLRVSQPFGCLQMNEKKNKQKMVLLVGELTANIYEEGDLKAPFSLTTTPRSRGGHCSFSLIAPLYP